MQVYEATTAVGLSRHSIDGSTVQDTTSMGHTMIMVTTDGSDSCMPKDDYCGLVAPNLASLMIEVRTLHMWYILLFGVVFCIVCVCFSSNERCTKVPV